MNILKILTPKRIVGNFGEKAAARMLRRKGYRILEQNYIAKNAEIDIIASKKDVTVFVEVKTRSIENVGGIEARPASSVTPEKQRKIIKAAGRYTSHHTVKTRLRFDVIEVYIERVKDKPRVKEIKHLEGAFDLNSAYDKNYYYIRSKEGSNL